MQAFRGFRRLSPLGALWLVLLLAGTAAAAPPWTDPARVTPVDGSWFSSQHELAAASGVLHIAFPRVPTGTASTVEYQRSIDGGEDWSPETPIFTTDATYTELTPNMAVAAFGKTVGVVWRSRSGADAVLLARFSPDAGLTWGARIEIARDTTTRRMGIPAMAMSPSGIFVAWSERSSGRILLRQSIDGGTSFGNVVQIATTQYSLACSNPVYTDGLIGLAASGSGVVVTWIDQSQATCGPTRLRIRGSIDGGVTWRAARLMTSIQTYGWPELAMRGQMLFAFVPAIDGSALLLRSANAGLTFSHTSVRASGGSVGAGDVAFGPGRAMMVVYPVNVTAPDGSLLATRLRFRESANLGITWSPPGLITSSSGLSLNSPQMAYLRGDPVVVYTRSNADFTDLNLFVVRRDD